MKKFNVKTSIVARQGDTVEVLNYRMRPARWEAGLVIRVDIRVGADLTSWPKYEVAPARLVPYTLTVNSEGIR